MKQERLTHTLIMGDFNYPNIDYKTQSVTAGSGSDSTKFFETTQDLFLVQKVLEPTRIRGGQIPSVLDYIFISEEDLIDTVDYEVLISKSDHLCLTWQIVVEREEVRKDEKAKLNSWKGDFEGIAKGMKDIDWTTKFASTDSADDMWKIFKQNIMSLAILHIPRKKAFIPKKSDWISKDTLKYIKSRDEAWKRYRQYRYQINYSRYKKVRNIVNRMVNPLDARSRYTDFAQTFLRRQKSVYRRHGISTPPPEAGIPVARYIRRHGISTP